MGTGAGAVRDRRQERREGAPVKRRRTRGRLAGASNERQWRALGGTVIERMGGRRSRAAVRGIRGTVRGLDVRGRQRRCPANSESVTSQEVFPLVGRMRTGIAANWTSFRERAPPVAEPLYCPLPRAGKTLLTGYLAPQATSRSRPCERGSVQLTPNSSPRRRNRR